MRQGGEMLMDAHVPRVLVLKALEPAREAPFPRSFWLH